MYKGVPNRFVYVGNMKPLAVNDVIGYSDWPGDYLVHEIKYSWKQYSEDEIKSYRDAEKSNEILNENLRWLAFNSKEDDLSKLQICETEERKYWKVLEKNGEEVALFPFDIVIKK